MKNLYKALFNVKKEMDSVKKKADNPFFKSKYADLNTHLELVEPLLEKNGLLLLQPTKAVDGTTVVETTIVHVDSGESLTSSMTIPPSLTDAQKIGACVTYFRRFIINSTFGMMSEDNDGNDVVGNGVKSTPTQTTKTTKLDNKSSFSGNGKAF